MITNSLNAIRIHLGEAKRLSEQACSAFTQLDEGSQASTPTLSRLAEDSYQASLDDQETDSSGAGHSAGQGLSTLAQQQQVLATGVSALNSARDPMNEALRAAQNEALQLGIPGVDSWFLRNAIDSAETQEGNSSQNVRQIESEVDSAQYGIGRAQSAAADVSRDQEGESVRFAGDRLQDDVDDIDDSFREIASHSSHGVRAQERVAYFLDQALSFADQLEKEFGQAPAPAPAPGNSAVAPPSQDRNPPISPQPPAPPAKTLPSPQPNPEGFFKKSWQGSRRD